MKRIEKPYDFFRENYHYFFGAFWVLAGIVQAIAGQGVLALFYVGLGLVGIIYKLFSAETNQEYIAWDERGVEIAQLYNSLIFYSWEEIDKIKVTAKNLRIKSGAASGIMVELKGFREDDIKQFSEQCSEKLLAK